MWNYIYTDELYHHGIKGQKWGVRRFQNEDGTRTAAGKKRAQTAEEKRERRKKIATGIAVGTAATAAAVAGGYTLYRQIKNDPAKAAKRELREKAKRRFMMTDDELKEGIASLELMKKYGELTNENVSKGKATVSKIITAAGTSAATTVATGALLYTVKSVLTKELSGKDAAGYLAPKPKKK